MLTWLPSPALLPRLLAAGPDPAAADRRGRTAPRHAEDLDAHPSVVAALRAAVRGT
ncbi:hypothetical protein [Dactylosporangium sp. NPDC005555]|uniref:hypothetical protein n=1 Tax=Dactylosporangium sp. NPDC005555 TaxID=3154889 RepID=UPI0033AB6238